MKTLSLTARISLLFAVAVTDAAGEIGFASSGADFPQTLLYGCRAQPSGCTAGTLQQWKQSGTSYRGMAVSMTTGNGEPYTMAVALDIQHHVRFMNTFQSVLGLA